MRRRHHDQAPGAVVVRAYLAANRGRYAEANRQVVPDVVRQLQATGSSLKQSLRFLSEFERDYPNGGKVDLGEVIAIAKLCSDPHFCWKVVTREGSIQSVEVVREQIRGQRAKVVVAVHLRDGSVVEEKETLLWNGDRWLIG
jgi:hypothetical protein